MFRVSKVHPSHQPVGPLSFPPPVCFRTLGAVEFLFDSNSAHSPFMSFLPPRAFLCCPRTPIIRSTGSRAYDVPRAQSAPLGLFLSDDSICLCRESYDCSSAFLFPFRSADDVATPTRCHTAGRVVSTPISFRFLAPPPAPNPPILLFLSFERRMVFTLRVSQRAFFLVTSWPPCGK